MFLVMVSKPYYPLNMLKYRWLATVYQLNTNPIKSHRNPSIIPQEHLPPKYFFGKNLFPCFYGSSGAGWQLSDDTDWTYEIPSNPFPSCHDIIFSGSNRNYHF